MKKLVVKDNLVKFDIISLTIFPTTALQSSREKSRIVRKCFAPPGQNNNYFDQIETVIWGGRLRERLKRFAFICNTHVKS